MIRRVDKYAESEGLTMIDSAKPLDVRITKADVNGSTPLSPSKCAIARALKRNGATEAFVFRSTAWVNDGKGHLIRYSLPPRLQKEVHAYDRAKMFEPGEYHLGPAAGRTRKAAEQAGQKPRAKYYANNRKYYAGHKDGINAKRAAIVKEAKADHKCIVCGKPAVNRSHCAECRDKHNAYHREARRRKQYAKDNRKQIRANAVSKQARRDARTYTLRLTEFD